nr:MAG TPA: hypothetical protein [Caudoviricetes sp.]
MSARPRLARISSPPGRKPPGQSATSFTSTPTTRP